MDVAATRRDLVAEALWGIKNEPSVHYAKTRPIDLRGWRDHRLPWSGDCSGSIKAIYAACGIDPDGGGNQGFTGTLLAAGEPIKLADVLPGDVGIFMHTADDTSHAVMALEAGAGGNPWVFSHGQEKGPDKIRLLDEVAYFKTQGEHIAWVTFLPDPFTWDVTAGDGSRLGKDVRQPGLWARAHGGLFRERGKVLFTRKGG